MSPLILALLTACVDASKPGGDSGGGSDGGGSDGGGSDGGGSDGGGSDGGGSDGGGSDGGGSEVPEGPDCSPAAWPFATPFNVLAAHVQAGTATGQVLADLEALAADLDGKPGPWSDTVVGPWTSADGLAWSSSGAGGSLTAASVPAALRAPGGDWWIFFVDGDLEAVVDRARKGLPSSGLGVPGLGGIQAARSKDGLYFERVELAALAGGPLIAVDPEILALPDGSFRMFYYGVPADQMCADALDPFLVPPPHQAWSAWSEDLVHWVDEGPVFTVESGGTDPAVWCTEDRSTCWILMGRPGVSADQGRSFSDIDMVLPEPPPQLPAVFGAEGSWRMLYRDPASGHTLTTTSEDGTTWTDGLEIDLATDAPSVSGEPGDWRAWGVQR